MSLFPQKCEDDACIVCFFFSRGDLPSAERGKYPLLCFFVCLLYTCLHMHWKELEGTAKFTPHSSNLIQGGKTSNSD